MYPDGAVVDWTLPRLIGRRLVAFPVSLVVIATFAFGLVSLMPGDPAVTILGQFASKEEVTALRTQLGMNLSFSDRYVQFMAGLLRGDLGTSFFSQRSVTSEIAKYLPATLELVSMSLVGSILIGLTVGGVSAYFKTRLIGRFSRGIITVFQSIPDFLLGLVLIYLLFFVLGVLPPPIGRTGFGDAEPTSRTGFLLLDTLLDGNFAAFWQAFKSSVMPVLTLSVVYSAYIGKTAQATIGTALGSGQIEYARASGLSEIQVFKYALRQARTPILTYGAILFGSLVGGAAIVETVFAWRGVGQWALHAMLVLDVPEIRGFVIVAGAITLIVYLALDVAIMILDPRVRIK